MRPLDPDIPLDTLEPGQSALISKIEGDAKLKLRLMEMGFIPGSAITFQMSTPFGDPKVYTLRGTSIALRKSEALCIHVKI